MPLKLKPPRPGKTPYWSVRGTYLGVAVDRSTGLADRAKAARLLRKWQEDIERGEFTRPGAPTFLSAAVAYLKAGGERRFIQPLLAHFAETALASIDQAAIDDAALLLYPNASPATRNRQVYTPVSAILKRAKVDIDLARPAGSAGTARTRWLWPEQAFSIFRAADEIDPEFSILLIAYTYCGPRLSELLGARFTCNDLRLSESFAFIGVTKNGDPRPVFLPPVVVAALANHPRGTDRGSEPVFRFSKSGRLYFWLATACAVASGLPRLATSRRNPFPAYDPHPLDFVGFHTLRHTWATWMRRYAGMDTTGLVATGVWRDRKSAARYEHVVVSEEAERAALLPSPDRRSA